MLAVLVVALGASLVGVLVSDDDGVAGAAPDEVTQILDGFATAFDEHPGGGPPT